MIIIKTSYDDVSLSLLINYLSFKEDPKKVFKKWIKISATLYLVQFQTKFCLKKFNSFNFDLLSDIFFSNLNLSLLNSLALCFVMIESGNYICTQAMLNLSLCLTDHSLAKKL